MGMKLSYILFSRLRHAITNALEQAIYIIHYQKPNNEMGGVQASQHVNFLIKFIEFEMQLVLI